MNTNTIGQAIRKYRQANKLSQDQLSKLSGISYHAIVKLEKPDKPANPTVGTITQIARALGISVLALIAEEQEKN